MGVLLRASVIEIATTCHYVLACSGIVHEGCKFAYHPAESRCERVGARESMEWPNVWRIKNEICLPFFKKAASTEAYLSKLKQNVPSWFYGK
jgi:hypothetical protein